MSIETKHRESRLHGTPICAGIAIGRPFFFVFSKDVVPEFSIAAAEIEDEVLRYQNALKRSKQDVLRLQTQLEAEGAVDAFMVIDTHLQIMQDPLITTAIEEQIRLTRKNAEHVFHKAIDEFEEKFNRITNPFFKERFKDIQDIARRVTSHLRHTVRISLADIPEQSVVFAHELFPSDTAEAKSSCVCAFVTEAGGETSHAAIVAKAKGIPYVANVDFRSIESLDGSQVIVDGRTGEVILNPSKKTLTKYRSLHKQLRVQEKLLEETSSLEAETIDGYRVRLSANIEMADEFDLIHRHGGRGVGLFRSEFLFLTHEDFPDEEKQFHLYSKIVTSMKGLPVVIRTFDVGGDKFGRLYQTRGESNPFLGCRAIRFLLKEREVFKTQLRAILRASGCGSGEVSIMFPMISGLPELLESKKLVQEAKEELTARGEKFAAHVRIGCMIEVPSAALTCDALAKECDFLSIGTNDLVQYSMAVDRGNQAMSYLYNPTHPSIIRLIKMVVSEGIRHGIPVSVCGEIAADPRFTVLLLGLGVQELSMSSRHIPLVKNVIRHLSIVSATQFAEDVLSMSTAKEIHETLLDQYRKNDPYDYLYNKSEGIPLPAVESAAPTKSLFF